MVIAWPEHAAMAQKVAGKVSAAGRTPAPNTLTAQIGRRSITAMAKYRDSRRPRLLAVKVALVRPTGLETSVLSNGAARTWPLPSLQTFCFVQKQTFLI